MSFQAFTAATAGFGPWVDTLALQGLAPYPAPAAVAAPSVVVSATAGVTAGAVQLQTCGDNPSQPDVGAYPIGPVTNVNPGGNVTLTAPDAVPLVRVAITTPIVGGTISAVHNS